MLGTAIGMMGGVSSVIGVYKSQGFFEQWPIIYIATHVDGSAVKKLQTLVKAWTKFVYILITDPPLIVHIHTSSQNSFWRKLAFILSAKCFRRPVIFHLHGASFDVFYNDASPIKRLLIRKTLESCTKIITLSDEWVSIIRKIAPKARLISIANPVVLPDLSCLPHQHSPTENILFLGRLGKRKGTYDLIHAFNNIANQFPRAMLQLGGDGEIDEARTLADELNLTDRIQFLGWITGELKTQLLLNAAIYVLPSYSEGLPMGILEAMSYKLPIVSTPVGGIPSAVRDEIEGLLVAPGDVTMLATAITRILQNPDLREKLGSSARLRAEQLYSAEVVLKKVSDTYKSILTNKNIDISG